MCIYGMSLGSIALNVGIRADQELITTKSADQIRQAYQLFSRHGSVTRDVLRYQCQKFGIKVDNVEVEALFQILDKDNSGDIDFQEFMQGIMAPDYQTESYKITAKHADKQDAFVGAAKSISALPCGQNANWLAWKTGGGGNTSSVGTGGHKHLRSSFSLG